MEMERVMYANETCKRENVSENISTPYIAQEEEEEECEMKTMCVANVTVSCFFRAKIRA